MIRTLAEIQADSVTITVTVDTEKSTERTFTSEEVGNFQASEAELVAAPLRAEVTKLEKMLAKCHELMGLRHSELNTVEKERDQYRSRVSNMDRQLAKQTKELEWLRAQPDTVMASYVQARNDRDALVVQRDQLQHDLKDTVQRLAKANEATSLALNERDELQKQMAYQRERAENNKNWAKYTKTELATQVNATRNALNQLAAMQIERDRLKRELARTDGAESEAERLKRSMHDILKIVDTNRIEMCSTLPGTTEDPSDWADHLVGAIRQIRETAAAW